MHYRKSAGESASQLDAGTGSDTGLSPNQTAYLLKPFPEAIRSAIPSLAAESSISVRDWGFDPLNSEIDIFDDGTPDRTAIDTLRGKDVGGYPIRILTGPEILRSRDEVYKRFSDLRKDPVFGIEHISIADSPLSHPPGYFVELWCSRSTPENSRLDNVMIRGWRVEVLPMTSHQGPIITNPFIAISAGNTHALALRSNGTVVAWGKDDRKDRIITTIPNNLSHVREISAGWMNSLALKDDGTIVFWGVPDSLHEIPTLVNVTNVTGLATSDAAFTGVLRKDGTIVVRGSNTLGVLDVPVNLKDVTSLSCGGNHVLALKKDGTVVAWGGKGNNEFDAFGQAEVPPGLDHVVAIAAGGYHSLALKDDGTVVAWGNNVYNQSSVPSNLRNVIAISAGSRHSLALKKDGTVVAWGDNTWNQLNVPPNLKNVAAISAGTGYSLALTGDGNIVCWGDNEDGECDVPGT